MSEYVSPAQARSRLAISRTLFDKKFRPQLTEYRFGDRAIRYASVELDQLAAEAVAPVEQQDEGPMIFSRRTVKDALDHAWRTVWQHSKGARKKAQLMKVVIAEIGTKGLVGFDYNEAETWVDELRTRDLANATRLSAASHADARCARVLAQTRASAFAVSAASLAAFKATDHPPPKPALTRRQVIGAIATRYLSPSTTNGPPLAVTLNNGAGRSCEVDSR